eukprot:TCONS_00052779-protein
MKNFNESVFNSKLTDIKKPIKVFARVRPFNDDEIGRCEKQAVETFDDEKRIKVLDERHSQEMTYHFDGVFAGKDNNQKVYQMTTKPLLRTFLNGINCAVLTYGQTGSGKTYTAMADGCITEFAIEELFDLMKLDVLHEYKIYCSFVQIYLEKIYDLFNDDNHDELLVREHPKKGLYVENLTHEEVGCRQDIFALLKKGKELLVTAETNMVRHSSRSHSVFQITIERRKIKAKEVSSQTPDGRDSSFIFEELIVLEDEITLKAKMQICDLAGSERLAKTMVEGVNQVEARHINSSLLELGNVINSLSSGKVTHVPFRNSTLTRLLQECLGSKCLTSFIVCVAPSASESYETRCSLNFGARARTITNKERVTLNVEVDYRILARKMSKRIEELEKELNSSGKHFSTITSQNQIHHNNTTPSHKDQWSELNQTLLISELLDTVLETEEEQPQLVHQGYRLSHLRLTNIINIVLKRLKDIPNKIQDSPRTYPSSLEDLKRQIINETKQKLRFLLGELHSIDVGDSDDLFRESAYSINETCTDIENALWDFLKSVSSSTRRLNNNEHTNSFYQVVEMAITDLKNASRDTSADLLDTQYLFYILQMLQVIRLFLECNLRKHLISGNQLKATSAESVNLQQDSYSLMNSTFSSPDFPKESPESVIDQDSPIDQDSTSKNTPSPRKLQRSPAFKIKKDQDTETPLGVPFKHLSSSHLPKTIFNDQHQDSDDGVVTMSSQDETGYVSLQEEHGMLQQMYTKAMQENERLKDANAFMQQKLSTLVNLKHREVFGSSFDIDKEKEPASIDKHNLYNKLFYEEMSFDQLNELTSNSFEISTGQQPIYNHQAKDVSALESDNNLLQAENKALLMERNELKRKMVDFEEYIEENSLKCKQLETDLKLIENQNNTLLDQVVYLCGTLDVVKHLETTHRLPANKDELGLLESDLFFMIDQNVRYESALMEIKFKVTKHKDKITIDSTPSKMDILKRESSSSPYNDVITPESTSGKSGNKSKRSITTRASNSRASSPLVKKAIELKRDHRETVKNLRKESGGDHLTTLSKEVKTCRTTRTKELLQERLLMTQKITTLEKELVSKDEELEKNKLHVELLTQELGQIDLDSMNGLTPVKTSKTNGLTSNGAQDEIAHRESTFVKDSATKSDIKAVVGQNCVDISVPVGENDDIEIIEIPEIKYEDLMAFIRGEKKADLASPLGPAINDFDSSKNRRLIEREFKTQVVSLERANECLRESNTALTDELHLVRSLNRDQKEKIKELKFEIVRVNSEADTLKCQLKINQSGFENSRLKYEKQISSMRKQIVQQCYQEQQKL